MQEYVNWLLIKQLLNIPKAIYILFEIKSTVSSSTEW